MPEVQADVTGVRRGLISGSIAMISRSMTQICVLGVTVVATRTLPIEDFGVFAIASALILLSRNLFYVGPYEYLLKTPDSPMLAGSCFAANIILATLSAILLGGLGMLSRPIFGTDAVGSMLLVMIPALYLAAAVAWHEALLLRKLQMKRYYVFLIVGELAGASVALALLLSGFGVFALAVQIYARLVPTLFLYAVSGWDSAWRRFTMRDVAVVIRWSWSRYTGVLLNFGTQYGADFVLGILISPAATGVYRAGNRIVSALTDLFAQPLQKIVQANLSARAARGEAPNNSWLEMFAGIAAIGWAALAALAFAAQDLVPLILGEKWRVAAPVVVIFCIVRAFSLLDATTTSLLVSCDRQRYVLRLQARSAALALLASMLLAPFGPMAVAAGVGVAMVVFSIGLARESVVRSGAQWSDVYRTFAVAATPALGVALGDLLVYFLQDISVSRSTLLAGQLVAAAIGCVLGLLLVRQRLLASVRELAPAVLREQAT